MKKIKSPDFSASLLEAREWPEGMIVKAKFNDRLGKYVSGRRYGRWEWSSFRPYRLDDTQEDVFYFEIKKSGKTWIEGRMLYPNCLRNDGSSSDGFSPELMEEGRSQVRVDKQYVSAPGPEYQIIKNADSATLNKKFFIEGTEDGIMDMEGKTTTVKEAEYRIIGVNFKLSVQFKTPVYMAEARDGANKPRFNATAETIAGFGEELTRQQREVIAEWFQKELGGDIELRGNDFSIAQWYVKAPQYKGYPSAFSAGPFVNEKQADSVLDSIKKINNFSMFNPDKAEVEKSYSRTTVELPALIDWCQSIGIKTTMKQLLALRHGAVVGKDFGI
jgi:hypothetical protein